MPLGNATRAGFRVLWRSPAPDQADASSVAIPSALAETIASRRAICKACDEFNGTICEKRYPTGCCGITWGAFLSTGQCPNDPPHW